MKLALVVAALLALPATASATPVPIPPGPSGGGKEFTGHAAKPHRVKAPPIPRHPFMAANGRNAVHNDAYQSDTYRKGGPLGPDMRVFSQSVDGMGGIGSCGITIAFDKRGRLVTTCISATTVTLRLMNKDLSTVANYEVGPRVVPPGVNPFQSPGGAYFYVDNKDRAVVSIGREVQVIAVRGNSLVHEKTIDLSSVIPADDQLNSALPDWSGRLWFVSRQHGIVGDVDPASGRVLGTYRTGEAIGNSFAMDETGGVFIVTNKAQYRFDATRAGKPKVSWRVPYKNTGRQKPGQFDAGSGTTPTLMGKKYLSIADNAARMNVVVIRRERHLRHGQRRVVCQQPVFRKGAGDTENSIIATDRSMIVENNYGYFPPPDATSGGKTTTPGVARVDIKRNGRGCKTVWTSREITPSAVPKMSLSSGLIYLYTKPKGLPDAWYLTAVDFWSGKTVWSRLIGTGLLFNVHYAGLSISPKGVLFSGVLGGTVGVADR